jgi:hypothetical protein
MLVCLDFLPLVSVQMFKFLVTVLWGVKFSLVVSNWNLGILHNALQLCWTGLSKRPSSIVQLKIYDQSSQGNNELNNDVW